AVSNGLAEVRAEMAANFQETTILKQEILIARQEIKRAEDSINSLRQSVADNSGIRSELNSLQSQINDIVSKINSGSVSSGNVQSVQKYRTITQKISQFTDELNAYIKSGGTDGQKIRDIVAKFVDDLRNSI